MTRSSPTRRIGVGRPGAVLATVVAIVALLAVVLGPPDATSARAAAAPNVIVVMTDDQDVASLRVMPTVRHELANQGTIFPNFFATFPVCCPSRATFLTGQYAHNHGVLGNEAPLGGVSAFNDSRTLGVALGRAGYRTGYIGRYLNGYDSRLVPPGWDRWVAPVGRGAFRMYNYELNEGGRLRHYGREPADYQTDVYARKAAAFIRRSSGAEPFFLTLAPLAPHKTPFKRDVPNPVPAPRHEGAFRDRPLPRPPSFNELDVTDKPAYVQRQPLLDREARGELAQTYRDRLASLLAVDDAVRRVLRELRDSRELSDTVILFTSDNGYLLGEHRLTNKGVLYEESARVPLIARGPGFGRGEVRTQVTGNVDLAPTILDLAGLDSRGQVEGMPPTDGRSLLPLAAGVSAGADRDILLENQKSAGIRTGRYAYFEHRSGEVELYDLALDPFQLESRHDDPRLTEVRATLAGRLAALRACAGDGCR